VRDTGYVDIWGVSSILIEEDDSISIIPKTMEDIKKCRTHFNDHDFLLNYRGNINYKCTAFIRRVSFEFDQTMKLFPQYIVKRSHKDWYDGFELTGEVIDDFFNPVRYFYGRSQKEEIDYFHNSEIADNWELMFEGKNIKITLMYGDVLKHGIASDLKLHPKLKAQFAQTSDTEYIYRLYTMIVRFLQIIRYDIKCGELKIELLYKENDKIYYNGYMHDFCSDQLPYSKGVHNMEYVTYKPYIQRFLQFVANSPNYTFYHYPKNGIRFRGRDYTPIDYMNIFSAFEAECHAVADIYENTDATKVQAVKEVFLEIINEFPQKGLKTEETSFINEARNRLSQIGTQYGQTRKITNAYKYLQSALDSSIENIFYLPEYKLTGTLKNKDIKTIATFLAEKRGTVAHGGFIGEFSDVEAQKIRFLEVLTYAQLLKRLGLDDLEIERVIGVVFGCNHVLFKEEYLNRYN